MACGGTALAWPSISGALIKLIDFPKTDHSVKEKDTHTHTHTHAVSLYGIDPVRGKVKIRSTFLSLFLWDRRTRRSLHRGHF
jgi:hypothetical protein